MTIFSGSCRTGSARAADVVTDCIFCKIAAKKIPARTVYEDESVVAFEDINPQAPVHILVIPRKHISTSLEIEEEDHALIGRMLRTANAIARERNIATRGFRIVMNTNSEAGQTVYHIHLHLLGGRPMHWPPG
jgi:histidine triad (HIT) family protein